MVVAYKLAAMALAYFALWDALGRWRVRAPERRLQLQIYGAIAFVYCLLVVAIGGCSPALSVPPEAGCSAIPITLSRTFFALVGATFLALGSLELGVSFGFLEPSLPLLSRWWVRALFEGPVWQLLCRRRAMEPLYPDEAEASARHAFAGLVTIASAVWSLQVSFGTLEWSRIDPVAFVILLKAVNVWLDARIRPRQPACDVRRARAGWSVPG